MKLRVTKKHQTQRIIMNFEYFLGIHNQKSGKFWKFILNYRRVLHNIKMTKADPSLTKFRNA